MSEKIIVGILSFIAGILFASYVSFEVRDQKVKAGSMIHNGKTYRIVPLEEAKKDE